MQTKPKAFIKNSRQFYLLFCPEVTEVASDALKSETRLHCIKTWWGRDLYNLSESVLVGNAWIEAKLGFGTTIMLLYTKQVMPQAEDHSLWIRSHVARNNISNLTAINRKTRIEIYIPYPNKKRKFHFPLIGCSSKLDIVIFIWKQKLNFRNTALSIFYTKNP